MATVQIPDFNFAAFYYPQLLDSLMAYKRANLPELTDESPEEPTVQFMRAFALIGHLNSVDLDLVANESTLPTSLLLETVRNMLRLIDYELAAASPSTTDVLYELAQVLAATTEVVPANALSSTRRQPSLPAILFERLAAVSVERTDQMSYCLADESGTFVDHTADANNQVTGNEFTPWATPAVKDALYFGHKQGLWAELQVAVKVAASGVTGVWEYYDGDWVKAEPDSVTDMTGYLRLDLTAYLGATSKAGTRVRLQFNETGAFEEVDSVWTGSANVADTTTYLGQTTPSTDAEDYAVGSDWQELSGLTDGTSDLTATGTVDYTLPQSVTEDWLTTVVDSKTAYWLRYRVVAVSAPTGPDVDYARIDTGKQYALALSTQGQTQVDSPLGSSDGTAGQIFETSKDNYIGGMVVVVSPDTWVEVDDFLNSLPTDRHYRVVVGEDARASVVFGDGTAGKVPPVGVDNVDAAFRYGADQDGNVGAGTVVVDKAGLTYVSSITNPRPASGWAVAEGSTAASLERAKLAGPASLRVQETALGPDDVETLTLAFEDEGGSRPFSRVLAVEEAFGPKTVGVYVVAAGGGQASAAQLAALELHLNGDRFASPPVRKRLVQNQEATALNHTQKAIDVTATAYGGDEDDIRTRLAQVFQPEALNVDGTYKWQFGEDVATSKVGHEIHDTSPIITKVTLTVPAADVVLGQSELPTLGTVAITTVP